MFKADAGAFTWASWSVSWRTMGGVDAIFSDLGDTLVRIRADRFFARLGEIVPGLDPLEFRRRILEREVYQDFARGRVDGPAFARTVAGILGVEWSFEEFREVWVDMMDPIPGAEEAFRLALGRVPVYVLSNTDPVHVAHILERFPWVAEATGLFLSYEEGLLKPDPGFYSGALERWGLEAGRVVFVDDREENVGAARDLGLRAVLVDAERSFARVVAELWG